MTAAGRQAKADGLAEDWIRQNPKDASMLAYLGAREMRARRYEAAVKRYQTALQRLPDNPLFLNNLAWASHQLKQPAALEYAERAFELAPRNPAVMDTLGMILSDKGETERGLELLGSALGMSLMVSTLNLLMNELYENEWRHFHNFYRPSVKLLSKTRDGAKTIIPAWAAAKISWCCTAGRCMAACSMALRICSRRIFECISLICRATAITQASKCRPTYASLRCTCSTPRLIVRTGSGGRWAG